MILIGLPVPIIVNNFSNFYGNEIQYNKFLEKVKARQNARINIENDIMKNNNLRMPKLHSYGTFEGSLL